MPIKHGSSISKVPGLSCAILQHCKIHHASHSWENCFIPQVIWRQVFQAITKSSKSGLEWWINKSKPSQQQFILLWDPCRRFKRIIHWFVLQCAWLFPSLFRESSTACIGGILLTKLVWLCLWCYVLWYDTVCYNFDVRRFARRAQSTTNICANASVLHSWTSCASGCSSRPRACGSCCALPENPLEQSSLSEEAETVSSCYRSFSGLVRQLHLAD